MGEREVMGWKMRKLDMTVRIDEREMEVWEKRASELVRSLLRCGAADLFGEVELFSAVNPTRTTRTTSSS